MYFICCKRHVRVPTLFFEDWIRVCFQISVKKSMKKSEESINLMNRDLYVLKSYHLTIKYNNKISLTTGRTNKFMKKKQKITFFNYNLIIFNYLFKT